MRFQMFCRKCYRVFENESLDAALADVVNHESEVKCRRPVYDAEKGRFLKDDEFIEMRAKS